MQRLLREPLLHFFILGAVLFGVYGWLHRGMPAAQNEIVVSRGQIHSLRVQFERVWQRPPTSQELQGLVDNWVRDEIFYREGMAMGLDRDDPVVRRRIGQKMEFIMDSAEPVVPTTDELQAWLDAHPERYAVEPRYTLRQVYFNPVRQGDSLETAMLAARRSLEHGGFAAGDSTLLPPALTSATADELMQVFGPAFERAMQGLPVGSWQGPVRSSYGVHLVELSEREPGRRATLEEARAAVERDLLHARREEADAALYGRLRANYTVHIDSADGSDADPAG